MINKLCWIFIVCCCFSCKKEKEEPAPLSPAPITPVTPAPKISAKINGAAFSYDITAAYKFGNPANRTVVFTNNISDEEIQVNFSVLPVTGSYTLSKNGSPFISYLKNDIFYSSVQGNLNITEIDTFANGVIHKMTGTFNCKTDTLNNISFDLTEGTLNY